MAVWLRSDREDATARTRPQRVAPGPTPPVRASHLRVTYRQTLFMSTRASFSGSWCDDTEGETTSARM